MSASQIFDTLTDAAADVNISPDTTAALVESFQRRLFAAVGGTLVYIPMRERTRRDVEIRHAYRLGENVTKLAVRFKLTESRVRQIVAAKAAHE